MTLDNMKDTRHLTEKMYKYGTSIVNSIRRVYVDRVTVQQFQAIGTLFLASTSLVMESNNF